MKKLLLSIHLLLIGICESNAQIQANNAMFNLNPTYYNPAYSGLSESGLNAVVLSRVDWVSSNNVSSASSPWNTAIALDKRFDSKNIAIGCNIASNNVGRMNAMDIVGNVAYHLHINERNNLSFGAKVGFNYVYLKDMQLLVQQDEMFNDAIGSFMLPKIGFGLMYKNENFFAGFSSPDMIVVDNKNILASNGVFSSYHYNLNAGYQLKLNENLFIQPSFLSVINTSNISKTDINFTINKTESFWGGVSFSPNNSYSAMGGLTINGRFKLSYAFTLFNKFVANPTSHELCLNWDLEDVF